MKNILHGLIIAILLLSSCGDGTIIVSSNRDECVVLKGDRSVIYRVSIDSSHVAINKAICMVPIGGELIIEEGVYSICSPIILKSDITLSGKGGQKPKLLGCESTLFKGLSVDNILIKNLELSSSVSNSTFNAIHFDNSTGIIIESIVINGSNGYGVCFEGAGSVNNQVLNCEINDSRKAAGIGCISQAGGVLIEQCRINRTLHHGIIISGGSNCIVKGNFVAQSGFYRADKPLGDFCHGIAIDGNCGKWRGKNHIIISNTIIDSGAAGIEIADGIDSIVIRNNIIKGTGCKAPWDKYGIYFGGSYAAGTYAEIVSNEVSGCKWSGIRVDSNYGKDGFAQDVVIDSNYVHSIEQDGILIGTAKNIKVRGNTIYKANWNGIKVVGLPNMLARDIELLDNNISNVGLQEITVSCALNISSK